MRWMTTFSQADDHAQPAYFTGLLPSSRPPTRPGPTSGRPMAVSTQTNPGLGREPLTAPGCRREDGEVPYPVGFST